MASAGQQNPESRRSQLRPILTGEAGYSHQHLRINLDRHSYNLLILPVCNSNYAVDDELVMPALGQHHDFRRCFLLLVSAREIYRANC